jgi:hypothetical protein
VTRSLPPADCRASITTGTSRPVRTSVTTTCTLHNLIISSFHDRLRCCVTPALSENGAIWCRALEGQDACHGFTHRNSPQVACLDYCKRPRRILSLSHFVPLSHYATESPLLCASIALGSPKSPESPPAMPTKAAAATHRHWLSRQYSLTSYPLDGLLPLSPSSHRFSKPGPELMEPYRPYHAYWCGVGSGVTLASELL